MNRNGADKLVSALTEEVDNTVAGFGGSVRIDHEFNGCLRLGLNRYPLNLRDNVEGNVGFDREGNEIAVNSNFRGGFDFEFDTASRLLDNGEVLKHLTCRIEEAHTGLAHGVGFVEIDFEGNSLFGRSGRRFCLGLNIAEPGDVGWHAHSECDVGVDSNGEGAGIGRKSFEIVNLEYRLGSVGGIRLLLRHTCEGTEYRRSSENNVD